WSAVSAAVREAGNAATARSEGAFMRTWDWGSEVSASMRSGRAFPKEARLPAKVPGQQEHLCGGVRSLLAEVVMNASAERTRSIWMDIEVAPRAPMLDQDLSVDTVIVGSGIAGLSVAYELAVKGRKVAVLDRGAIAGGMT